MKYLLLLFLFCSHILIAQDSDFLIGKWQVEHTFSPLGAPAKMEKQLSKLRAAYDGASFEFTSDAKFTLKSKEGKTSIENGYWVYDPKTRIIKVCKWDNRDQVKPVLLEFSARKEKDRGTYFSLLEAPVAMKVKKD